MSNELLRKKAADAVRDAIEPFDAESAAAGLTYNLALTILELGQTPEGIARWRGIVETMFDATFAAAESAENEPGAKLQ